VALLPAPVAVEDSPVAEAFRPMAVEWPTPPAVELALVPQAKSLKAAAPAVAPSPSPVNELVQTNCAWAGAAEMTNVTTAARLTAAANRFAAAKAPLFRKRAIAARSSSGVRG
jgi:hypothetical protein